MKIVTVGLLAKKIFESLLTGFGRVCYNLTKIEIDCIISVSIGQIDRMRNEMGRYLS